MACMFLDGFITITPITTNTTIATMNNIYTINQTKTGQKNLYYWI